MAPTTSSTSSTPSSPPPAAAASAVNADQVSHGLELGLAAVSVLVALAGFFLAYLWYYKKPGTAAALAERVKPRLRRCSTTSTGSTSYTTPCSSPRS